MPNQQDKAKRRPDAKLSRKADPTSVHSRKRKINKLLASLIGFRR